MWIKNRLIFQFLFLLVISLLSACGGGSGGEDGPALTDIEISTVSTEPTTNSETPLEIVANYSDGSSNNITTGVTWTSSDPSIATVSDTGLLETANIVDEVTVTANYNGLEGTAILNIKPGNDATLESIALPASIDVTGLSEGDDIAVMGTYSDGSTDEDMAVSVRSIESTSSGSELRIVVAEKAFIASSSGSDDSVFSIKTLPTNIKPEINSTGIEVASDGISYSYDVDASDDNEGDVLHFSLDTFPEGMTIDSATGMLSWTPSISQLGSHDVSIKVADNGIPVLSDTQTFSITVIPVDRQAPAIPSNVIASVVSDTQIDLSWTASNDEGGGNVAGYKIFIDGSETAIEVTGTSYSHTDLSARSSHTYTVSAFDDADPSNESAKSASISATTTDTQAPTVPMNVATTVVNDTQINLSWAASTEMGGGIVAGYKIYVDGNETAIATVTTGTSYSHSGLNASSSHTYTVSAYDDASPSNESAKSAIASATTTDSQAPTVPTGVTATFISDSQIDLSWEASTDLGGSNVAGYNIYVDGDVTPIATVMTGTIYSDTELSTRTSHSYTVSAFDDAIPSNESGKSEIARAPDTLAPTVPMDITAKVVSDTQIDLTWTASTEVGGGDVAGYNIYVDVDGVETLLDTVTETSYSHIELEARNTYSYSVTAFDDADPKSNESAKSEIASATTSDSQAPSTPTGLTAKVINSDQVNLRWNKSVDAGGGTITAYNLYVNGDETPLITLNATQYSHTIAPHTLYNYTVTAVDDIGNESLHSDLVTASSITFPFNEDFSAGVDDWVIVENPEDSSDWAVKKGKLVQTNERGALRDNKARKAGLDGTYHLGTYAYLRGGEWLTDYRISLEMTPIEEAGYSETDVGHDIGVMFRYQNDDSYYRVSLNSAYGYARLERRHGGEFKTLATDARGYLREGKAINVEIEVKGPVIQVFIDDEPRFAFRDPREKYIKNGTVALYTQDGAKFDNIKVDVNSSSPTIVIGYPTAYTGRSSETFEVSAAVLNMPWKGSVEFDLDGAACGLASEAITGSGYYRANCTAPGKGEHTITATLKNELGGIEATDSNSKIGSSADVRLIIGDSISNGITDTYSLDNHSQDGKIIGEGGYAATLQDLMNVNSASPQIIFNEAVPGAFTGNLLNEQIDSILERHPYANIAQVMIGTNDAIVKNPISSGINCPGPCSGTFRGNMQRLIDKLENDGITPIIALLPPSVVPNDPRNAIIQEYNQVLATKLSMPALGPDFYSYFLNSEENRVSMFTDDIHFNGLGYLIAAHLWEHYLNGGTSLPSRDALPLVLEDICVRIDSADCQTPVQYKQDLMQIDRPFYIDADYLAGIIPDELKDGVWIKTADSHKANTRNDYLTFNVDRDVEVYVAYDARVSSLPAWMSDFTDTEKDIIVTNGSTLEMRLYKKNFALGVNTDGNIQLGGNLAGGDTGALSNYVVIVKEL